MKIFVCWDKRATHPLLGDHPCGQAYEAVREAGYDPDVVHALGWKVLPSFLNMTPGRREVKRLTGKYDVPVLVTDSGEIVDGWREIVEWAGANPATTTAQA